MCGHFQSREKDGRRTIRSVISENPMIHANLMALELLSLTKQWQHVHCEHCKFYKVV